MSKKLEVIKKLITNPCYCCSPIGGKPTPRKECKVCNGTGKYVENFYYHIYTDKKGQKICISKDTVG